MQDPNSLVFDTLKYKDSSELIEQLGSMSEDLTTANVKNPFAGMDSSLFDFGKNNETSNTPKIDTTKINQVKEDVKNQKIHNQNKIKANIFDTLFANELQAYFDEHKHIMPSRERKVLKAILIKKINKGDIYLNKVGKLIIRKGKNK